MLIIPYFVLLLGALQTEVAGAGNGPNTRQGPDSVSLTVGAQAPTTNNLPQQVTYNQRTTTQNNSFRILIRRLVVIQLLTRLLSSAAVVDNEETTAPSTTGPADSSDTTAIPAKTVPAPFSTWYEYKGCRYQIVTELLNEVRAIEYCANLGSNTGLAQKNIRTLADRKELLVNGLGVSGVTLWVGLKDDDGTGPITTKWFDGTEYSTETGVTESFVSTTFSSQALASGFEYNSFIFTTELSRSTSQFICEYCPA